MSRYVDLDAEHSDQESQDQGVLDLERDELENHPDFIDMTGDDEEPDETSSQFADRVNEMRRHYQVSC